MDKKEESGEQKWNKRLESITDDICMQSEL